MNVSLTPELEKFVSAKVESGLYNSASAVVREAFQLLEEPDRPVPPGWPSSTGSSATVSLPLTATKPWIPTRRVPDSSVSPSNA